MMWLVLFAAVLGAPIGEMKPMFSAGPFPEELCYAVAAVGVSDMNARHPGRDFRAACLPDGGAEPDLAAADPRASLDLPELVARIR